MADKRWRGAVFDFGVFLVLGAIVSGGSIYAVAAVSRFGRRALVWAGVL